MSSLIRGDVRITLIDLRDANDAPMLRVPDAIRLHPWDVATNAFLASDASIALLGMQADTPRLLRLCRQLRSDGWRDVRVVRGGLHAWLAGGGASDGDLAALATLERIDTPTLFEVLHTPDAVVLAAPDATLPTTMRAAVLPDTPTSITHLARMDPAERPALVAMIGGTNTDLAQKRAAFRDADLPAPLFHPGTLADLDAWIARQERMRRSASTPLSQDCKWN